MKKIKIQLEGKAHRKVSGRVSFVYGIVFVSFSALLFRLAYLQVNRGNDFRSQASNQQISYVPVLPERGWIYDTNHQLLAYDTPSIGIVLTRLHNSKIQNYAMLAKLLAPVLRQSEANLFDKMKNENTWQDQIFLLQDANDTQVSFVAENKSELPGVELVESSKRAYPHGNLAGQVIGYVGAIQGDNAKKYIKQGYQLDQIVGQSGIEIEYEHYLQGRVGRKAVIINNLGIPIKSLGLNPPPTPGDSLQLTIDGHLQSITQQVLANELSQLAQQGTDVNQAAAVMLNPKTGAVLSMASYPYLNPNWFLDPKQYQQHANEFNHFPSPLYNNATQGVYMPGSTVKPGNILLGLLDKVITPTTSIIDNGVLMIGNHPMHGDDVYGVAGPVDAVRALQISDDIFMYQMSLWMAHYPPTNMSINTWLNTTRTRTLQKIYDFEKKLGLGVKTGIDLPSESTGFFSDSKILYDLPAAAIGQRQAFTPLQLADYVATIANSGVEIQPHLLQTVISPTGKVIATYKPKIVGKISAPQAYWEVLHQGMHLVTDSPQGTASGSFMNAPYQAAGKTGTSQQGKGNDDALFISYAPYNDPQVAVAVVIPNGGYGAMAAVPVARKLMDAYFKEHHEFFPQSQWTNTIIPN